MGNHKVKKSERQNKISDREIDLLLWQAMKAEKETAKVPDIMGQLKIIRCKKESCKK